jgi:phosphate butyryltransferase
LANHQTSLVRKGISHAKSAIHPNMSITCFDDLIAAAQTRGPVRVAVAAAHDPEVLAAISRAQQAGMLEAILVGDWPAIEATLQQHHTDLRGTAFIHEADPLRAAQQAVALARDGQVDVVVKGQVKTAQLLSAVLKRHTGIRGERLASHVGMFELPGMDRLIYLSDSGVVLNPDVYQKLEIIQNVVQVCQRFGLAEPRVAILAASDTVHPKIPASIDALSLTKMAEQGWVEGAIVDGPMGLEVAISPQAARLEGSTSPIGGRADVLIVPNAEAGNIVAKGLLYFARARMAGVVVGARVPILINSRADSAETRFLSLAMATLLVGEDPARGPAR